ncbi:MAG: hypothetical protein IJE59_01740 [Clostridia bacterium]|nr:hypothetical protein [Clostridia bacterium]
MIILSKKKILFTLSIVAMFSLTYMITGYNVSNSKNNNELNVEAIQTVALPVDSKVIIIDAGHRKTR